MADAKKLTKSGHWGLTLEAGQIPENIHLAFELSQQQGGSFYNSAGKPTFDTPQNVAAIKQMIDFMQTDKIANPSDAQYSKGTEALNDYATGKAAMVFWQAASGSLAKLGMKASDIGVAPLPLPSPMPAGGKKVTSMVAGINIAIFKDTQNLSAAEKFVKFMTSTPEQESLNQTYGSLPTVPGRLQRPGVQHPGRAHVPQHPHHHRRADARGGHGEPVRDRGRHRDHPPVRRRGHRQDGHRQHDRSGAHPGPAAD